VHPIIVSLLYQSLPGYGLQPNLGEKKTETLKNLFQVCMITKSKCKSSLQTQSIEIIVSPLYQPLPGYGLYNQNLGEKKTETLKNLFQVCLITKFKV
jgi:hypothetical protein